MKGGAIKPAVSGGARDTIVAPRTPFVMALLSMLLLVGLFGGLEGTYGAVAWIFVAIFAACAVALLLPLVRRDRLLLTDDRFEFRASSGHGAIAWREVESFGVVRHGLRYAVGIRFVPARAGVTSIASRLATAGDRSSVLPGWYGLRADDLADILEERRRRAARA